MFWEPEPEPEPAKQRWKPLHIPKRKPRQAKHERKGRNRGGKSKTIDYSICFSKLPQ